MRVLLRDEDGEDRAHELFTAVDIELAEALSVTKLPRILHHALTCRNSWTGHGGVAGKQVHRERLRELEDLLAQGRTGLVIRNLDAAQARSDDPLGEDL